MEMMMASSSQEDTLRNPSIGGGPIDAPLPTWKLYENPFYYNNSPHHHHHHHQHHHHRFHLPLSARKLAASLWDLTSLHTPMDSNEGSLSLLTHRRISPLQYELDLARDRIEELKAELEFERKIRKKVESLNKRLTKEVCEERKGREGMERVCRELAEEIASDKAEMDRMKQEFEEERKMLRIAEVLREERVQMKMAEARVLLEEKILEFSSKGREVEAEALKVVEKEEKKGGDALGINDSVMVLSGNSNCCSNIRSTSQRRALSPEVENPHIRRGIKGFVEFPRVVRAVGSRGRQLGSKLECQKAQLRLLLRHKTPVVLGVAGTDNLIMG